ncbi:MAG: hypothetical protein ACE5GD_11490 [Candidatus Geothermarchaeales archaeon]
MAYASKEKVKELLDINTADYDAEIDGLIAEYARDIDNKLKALGVSTPITDSDLTPSLVDINARGAAGLFRSKRSPDGVEAVRFTKQAEEKLEAFIKAKYRRGVLSQTKPEKYTTS